MSFWQTVSFFAGSALLIFSVAWGFSPYLTRALSQGDRARGVVISAGIFTCVIAGLVLISLSVQ